MWLGYIGRGLAIAYEIATTGHGLDGAEPGGSTALTGVRWYATDLALLESLMFRAAGPRSDEQICFDQPISGTVRRTPNAEPQASGAAQRALLTSAIRR